MKPRHEREHTTFHHDLRRDYYANKNKSTFYAPKDKVLDIDDVLNIGNIKVVEKEKSAGCFGKKK